MLRRVILCFLAFGAPLALAVPPKPVEVMFLGTFHLANPGQDATNMQVDSVLTPARQKELEALANALADYKPTHIMVEREARAPNYSAEDYTTFKAADLQSESSELYQIGFRLANKVGLKKVQGIDERPAKGKPDYFPLQNVEAYAKSHGLAAEYDAWIKSLDTRCSKKYESVLKKNGIADLLIYLAGPDAYCSQQTAYNELLQFGDGDEQPGADLNAGWYLRNAKIFAKLSAVAKPGDRIIVIFGAGHSYWLKHFIQETPGFKLMDPIPYLKKARS